MDTITDPSLFTLKPIWMDLSLQKSFCWYSNVMKPVACSWVQSQLKEHPDELWEDGIREYLAHASDILVMAFPFLMTSQI